MKEILDEESKNALINYRIQRAYETLKEAQVMMRESFYNAAVESQHFSWPFIYVYCIPHT